jgi:hypothetical protein
MQGIQQPACPIYQPAVGQQTPDSTTQITKQPQVSALSTNYGLSWKYKVHWQTSDRVFAAEAATL